MFLFLSFYYIFFLFYHMACGILVPQPGIEPMPMKWKLRVLIIGPSENPREILTVVFAW